MFNGTLQHQLAKATDEGSAIKIQQSNAQSLAKDQDPRGTSQESLAAAETMDNKYLKASDQAAAASIPQSMELRDAPPGDQYRGRDQERKTVMDNSEQASDYAHSNDNAQTGKGKALAKRLNKKKRKSSSRSSRR